MINENLEKLVQHARDKKPTDFKEVLTDEIDSRIDVRVTEIKDELSQNMFKIAKLDEAKKGDSERLKQTYGVDKKTGKPNARPVTSSDLKAMAIETHTKSGFTAIASRNFPKPLPGIWLDDYVWEDKKMAVKAAQAWIDGFGDSDDYWKNADQGTKALEKFAKSNKKDWHARAKGESVQKESIEENCEGHPDGVEHTHDDGTVHTHPGGDKEHTHDEEVEEGKVYGGKGEQPWSAAQAGLGSNYDKKKDGRNAARKAKRDAAKAKKGKKDDQDEAFSLLPNVKDEDKAKKNPKGEGTLPPALQKAIDAKKKNKGDDDEDDKKEKDEGTLPPALQKAIDAKKKNNSKSDDVDKSPAKDDEDEDDKKQDENIDNFGKKKAKPFKKEDIRDAVKKILNREASGDKAAYQKKRDEVLKKYGVKACGLIKDEKEKKQCFQDLDDAHVADHEEN